MDYKTEIASELARLGEDVLYTEKGHFEAAETLGKVHGVLGGAATGFSAAATGTVLADQSPLAAGVLGLVATTAAAVLTFVKPQERAQQHLAAGRSLNALRVRIRQASNLDLHADSPSGPDDWRRIVGDFATEKAQIDGSAPGVSNRAFGKGRAKIREGLFEHGLTDGPSKKPEFGSEP